MQQLTYLLLHSSRRQLQLPYHQQMAAEAAGSPADPAAAAAAAAAALSLLCPQPLPVVQLHAAAVLYYLLLQHLQPPAVHSTLQLHARCLLLHQALWLAGHVAGQVLAGDAAGWVG
jgi:hypothetical protein